jgi:hypothetical protein
VNVEEFSSPLISRNSQMWQHCEVKNGAKKELLQSTPWSLAKQLP